MHAWVPSHSPVAVYARHATFIKSKLPELLVQFDNLTQMLTDESFNRGLAGHDIFLAMGGENFFRNVYLAHMKTSTVDTVMRAIPVAEQPSLELIDYRIFMEVRTIEVHFGDYLRKEGLKNADTALKSKYGKVILPGESLEKTMQVHGDVCTQAGLDKDTLTLDVLLLQLLQRLFTNWRNEPVGALDVYLHMETPFMCAYYKYSTAQKVEPIMLIGTAPKHAVKHTFEHTIPNHAKDKPDQLTRRWPVDVTIKAGQLWEQMKPEDQVPEYAIVELGGALKLANILYNELAERRATQHVIL